MEVLRNPLAKLGYAMAAAGGAVTLAARCGSQQPDRGCPEWLHATTADHAFRGSSNGNKSHDPPRTPDTGTTLPWMQVVFVALRLKSRIIIITIPAMASPAHTDTLNADCRWRRRDPNEHH